MKSIEHHLRYNQVPIVYLKYSWIDFYPENIIALAPDVLRYRLVLDFSAQAEGITLAGNSLSNVSAAIAISTATIKNIKQNLFGAFIFNIVGIPLAAGVFYPFTG